MGHRLTSGRPCDVCRRFLRDDNKYGVCTSTRECKSEHRRRYRADNLELDRRTSRDSKRRRRASDLAGVQKIERDYLRTVPGKAGSLLKAARRRARAQGLPFDLTREWVIRELESALANGCPYLGIPIRLDAGFNDAHCPSIDQFNPGAGYTQANCLIVSYKANAMKSDAPPEFVERLGVSVSGLRRTRFSHLEGVAA